MVLRIAFVLLALGVTGWLHGRWTDRWGASADVAAASARLPNVPLAFGDWEGRDITAEESPLAARATSPQIIRRYANRTTGVTVGVLVTCGRPSGMVIEHTPATCYKFMGFEEPNPGKPVEIGPESFRGKGFAHTFVKNTATSTTRVRVVWAWGDGTRWAFPEYPRVEFARTPVLYKIYVTRDQLSEEEPGADPALAFLAAALPDLTAALAPQK